MNWDDTWEEMKIEIQSWQVDTLYTLLATVLPIEDRLITFKAMIKTTRLLKITDKEIAEQLDMIYQDFEDSEDMILDLHVFTAFKNELELD